MLQGVLNKYGDEGVLLGDFLIILEGHTADGKQLRIMDPDLTFWDKLGFIRFLDAQIQAEMAGNVAWATAMNYQDGGGFNDEEDGEGSNA